MGHGQMVGVQLLALATREACCIPQFEMGSFAFTNAINLVPHQLFAPFAPDADLRRLVKETVKSPLHEEVKALRKTAVECIVLDNYNEQKTQPLMC